MRAHNIVIPDDLHEAIAATLKPGETFSDFWRSGARRELKSRKSPVPDSEVKRGRPTKKPAKT